MVLALRIIPIVLLVVLAFWIVRRVRSANGTANATPAGINSLRLALLGSLGLFVAFIGTAELITRI